MEYTEEKRDIFTVPNDYYLAHCIASDLGMGAGIAVPMQNKFNLREQIEKGGYDGRYPECVLTGRVFNLTTKWKSWGKPEYSGTEGGLVQMRRLVIENNIKKVAMPRIGCGLDRLDWDEVKNLITSIFGDTDVEILVCIWE